MNWDDLQKLWQSRTGGDVSPGAGGLRELIAEYEGKSGRWARILRRREYCEIVAGVLVAAHWLWSWHRLGDGAWPLAISVLLVTGVVVFEVRELQRRARNRVPVHGTVHEKVGADLSELRRQRWLLNNVWLWYVAPIIIGCLIEMNVTLRLSEPGHGLAEVLAGLGIFTIVAWGCVWLNRRAVRTKIDPEIVQLETLKAMLSEVGEEDL